MGIRLNKALKELNVGINTAAEFLQKKGMALEDASLNAKLTDEQYASLVSEFGVDKDKNKETQDTIKRRKELGEKTKAERKEKEKEAAKEKREQQVFHTQSEQKKKIEVKVVGKLEKKTKTPEKTEIPETPEVPKTPVTPKTSEAPKTPKAPKTTETAEIPETQETPKTQETPSEPTAETKTEPEVYRTETPDAGLKFKTVGFVDLTSINEKMHPDKKSKEERKKEREEKDALQQDKKKRQRINKGKVDINKEVKKQSFDPQRQNGGNGQQQNGKKNQQQNQQQGQGKKNKKKKNVKVELTEEEVAKQVKETLARLSNKTTKSGVKHRKENRERRRLEAEESGNAEDKILQLTEFVTANDLATMMSVSVTEIISTCMSLGLMVSINQRLDAETINIVAEEFGYTTNYVSEEVTHAITEEDDKEEDLESRAPIITVMGHVDHGKTSLLDYIRNANVIAGEAGGITQHIGAYNVKMNTGKHITFLDTPGHEAFTAMRARGAKVTDIAIIIIAADDEVMPQTKEAISHAVAAGVPMVFAINKIDKPTADPERIKQQLSQMNYLVEDWGGKYQCQEISAKKGLGVDELMEKVLLEAEILDLKANPNRNATGSVIESSLDKGRGYVSTVLVQNGTLRQGDVVLAGTAFGKIKAMFNERGQKIQQALPAEPALILGLNGAPTAGDTFHVLETEQEARELAHKRDQLKREQGLRTLKRVDLNELGRRIALGDFKELNIVVKGDVDGSIEAISDSLIKLSTDKIQVNVIHKAVGQISESDVTLAAASDAIIIGFQVRPSVAARTLATQEGVDIRLYSVIYDAIEEVKSAMEGMLAPEIKEEVTANLEVRQVYNISKVGTVAGAFVTKGKVKRSDKIRVIREGIVKHTGTINALKRFKDDVKEVSTNFDCGISITNYNDIKEGDILETFEEIKIKQKL